MAQTMPDPLPPLTILPPVRRWSPAWAIPEVPVPESDTHDLAIEWLRALLVAWVARTGRDIKVARNLGIRWVREEPRFGFDPDLCLIEPAPAPTQTLSSLRVWRDEHAAPLLAVEVVSPGHPYKDYVDTPERCAACGVLELWVYDPMLAGPRAHGGPHLLQLWRRRDDGGFERIFAGAGPVFSPSLGAWLHPRASSLPSGAHLLISNDPDGRDLWLTEQQEAHAAEQQARAAEQQARAAEQQARAAEREARELLERARAERDQIEEELRRREAGDRGMSGGDSEG
jgi:Uma2 family endonuclease